MRRQHIWSKVSILGLTLLLVSYALAGVFVWTEQKKFIFMPMRELANTPADFGLRFDDIFIHGTDDDLVPVSMSRQLFAEANPPKYLKLILGGSHNNSARVGGRIYLESIADFVSATSLSRQVSSTIDQVR